MHQKYDDVVGVLPIDHRAFTLRRLPGKHIGPSGELCDFTYDLKSGEVCVTDPGDPAQLILNTAAAIEGVRHAQRTVDQNTKPWPLNRYPLLPDQEE